MVLSRRGVIGLGLAMLGAPARAATRGLVMGTGRPGGAYTLYGPEWGRLAAARTGIAIAYRASGGAASNILLIEEGEAQLGMTTMAVAIQGLEGSGSWTAGVKFREFRALFPMFPSALQVVSPRKTGVRTLAELEGCAVGIGPDGGSGAACVPAILGALGVTPARAVTGDFAQQVGQMLAGRLAACAFIGAPPMPPIARAAMARRLALIGFTRAEVAQVARRVPGVGGVVLAPGMFPGQGVPVATVGTANFAIGAASLPDAVANGVTQAALANQATLARVVPAAGQAPQTGPIWQAGVAFHPGAIGALRRFGMDAPEGAEK